MPAARSRTNEWRRSLEELCQKGGALEVAIARDDARGHDLVWRLRILDVRDAGIVVENPGAFGKVMPLHVGTRLMAFIVIGQNRWEFRTSVLEEILPGKYAEGRNGAARLAMPDHVERCLRRHARYDVGPLALPPVDLWLLLDPKSVVAAERANELAFAALVEGKAHEPGEEDSLLPSVGPKLTAFLANVGGGGAGVVVEPAQAGALSRHRLFWVRIDLGDGCPVPIVTSAKLVHTHIDSSQRTYAGLSFDFAFNPAHQKTVASQVERSIRTLERRQQH
ncbi:MAG: flagellar brake protein [Planctomycetota bacterium]